MEIFKFTFEVVGEKDGYYIIHISDDQETAVVLFNFHNKDIKFKNSNDLVEFLEENKYQLSKILRNKRQSSYYIGFKVNIVMRDQKDVEAFNDRDKIVVLDQLDGHYSSYVVDEGKEDIVEVFTDGSFQEKYDVAGFSYIIKFKNGDYKLYQKKSKQKSSSLIELQAAIEALKTLKDEKYIRINTDSQYVRKGLTEWIINWKANGWKTANGTDVKNKKYWLLFEKLSRGKYIEFKHIKAHSKHFENTLADLYAADIALEEI